MEKISLIRSFLTFTPHQILFGLELDGRGMWDVWGRVVYRVLVGTPNGKRPLGKPRRRWEGNIKISL
jgi:hypothetical protein